MPFSWKARGNGSVCSKPGGAGSLATLPSEKAAVATKVDCELIAKVYAETNLLSQFEQPYKG